LRIHACIEGLDLTEDFGDLIHRLDTYGIEFLERLQQFVADLNQ
jgi:hypothetical protein